MQQLLHGPLGPFLIRFFTESAFGRGFSKLFGPKTKPGRDELHEFWQLIEQGDGLRLAHDLLGYIDDRKRHRDRWVDALRHAKMPMLLISGPEDPVSGRHMAERFRKRLPGSAVVLLEGIGHYPHVEAPDAVLQHYLGFLEGREVATDPAAPTTS